MAVDAECRAAEAMKNNNLKSREAARQRNCGPKMFLRFVLLILVAGTGRAPLPE